MSKSGLRFFAVLLSTLIVVVLLAGFDDLPRDLRRQIDAERSALASARTEVRAAQDDVNGRLQAEPALFAAIPSARQYPDRFGKASALLASAGRDMDELNRLHKANRRQDRDRVRSLLKEEQVYRSAAVAETGNVRTEAAHWVDLKQHLPQALQDMERSYRAARDYDMNGLGAAVQKAGTDWPDQKADLEGRLAAVRNLAADSEASWQASADARRQAAAGNLSGLDFGALFVAADRLASNGVELPRKAGELKSLTGQLYVAWDNILVDMQSRGVASKVYEQKIRTVRSKVADAASKGGETTSEDRWVKVSRAVYDSGRGNLGMAVAHKPAGKYDAEADSVAQPAGFAYMAPPGQSNRYGYWERRDGRDFWVFYGQYALLRDLLFNRDYRPLDRGDWDGYRNSQSRGQTYYGNDSGSGQKYGTKGASTQQRYSDSTFARGGGFKDSKFATKSGSYKDSPYATPGARQSGGSEPRTFGRSTPRSPAPSYRPRQSSPSRSFSMPRSSPGRTFGRRR